MGKIAAKEKHQVPPGCKMSVRLRKDQTDKASKDRQVYYWFDCLTSFLHFICSLKSYNMNKLCSFCAKKKKKKGGPLT